MPDRTTKSAERCSVHPGRAAVAGCDGCGRAVCLACAVPVRGRILCPTCLAGEIGPEHVPDGARPGRRRSPATTLAGAAMAAGLATTAFPWSRFGVGSGAFGAWGWPFRWSLMAAVGSAVGLAIWVWFGIRPAAPGREGLAFGLASSSLALGAALAITRPPPFAHAAAAPWVAVAAGAAGILASLALARTKARS